MHQQSQHVEKRRAPYQEICWDLLQFSFSASTLENEVLTAPEHTMGPLCTFKKWSKKKCVRRLAISRARLYVTMVFERSTTLQRGQLPAPFLESKAKGHALNSFPELECGGAKIIFLIIVFEQGNFSNVLFCPRVTSLYSFGPDGGVDASSKWSFITKWFNSLLQLHMAGSGR